MLQRVRRQIAGAMMGVEVAAVDELARVHEGLLMLSNEDEDSRLVGAAGIVDVQSEEGHAACARFLSSLERSADVLGVEIVPRTYRVDFSVNYRALFAGSARHYRADILEEFSGDRSSAIWVNGEKFELSTEVIACGAQLHAALMKVGVLLVRWRDAVSACTSGTLLSRPSRAEFAVAFSEFDEAWAALEYRYITNLIAIEDRARQLILRAVEAERRLSALEEHGSTDNTHPGSRFEAETDLVACIAKLNSVANCRRKGRDDLGQEILEGAVRALGSLSDATGPNAGRLAARALAGDIVGSFSALREYLRHIATCFERVDPHLCNNNGLVTRLVDWEESWEVGGRYVRSDALLDGLCRLVAEIRDFQAILPRLTAMCEDCDVEWFMVLPRITLLAFLRDPHGDLNALLRMLLPHRFHGDGCPAENPAMPQNELQDLVRHFEVVYSNLCLLALHGDVNDCKLSAWEVLARRALGGSSTIEPCAAWQNGEASCRLDSFCLKLEHWSLELQRHCPEDWNQCSAVLVQCLSGASKRQKFVKFQV